MWDKMGEELCGDLAKVLHELNQAFIDSFIIHLFVHPFINISPIPSPNGFFFFWLLKDFVGEMYMGENCPRRHLRTLSSISLGTADPRGTCPEVSDQSQRGPPL